MEMVFVGLSLFICTCFNSFELLLINGIVSHFTRLLFWLFIVLPLLKFIELFVFIGFKFIVPPCILIVFGLSSFLFLIFENKFRLLIFPELNLFGVSKLLNQSQMTN